jgi:hypothetical protein
VGTPRGHTHRLAKE